MGNSDGLAGTHGLEVVGPDAEDVVGPAERGARESRRYSKSAYAAHRLDGPAPLQGRPIDGQGCGGSTFSWTAAIWLAWGLQELGEE